MRNAGGGSVHDPGSKLPLPMWKRVDMAREGDPCRGCSTGNTKVRKKLLRTSEGVVSICAHCDGGVWATKA